MRVVCLAGGVGGGRMAHGLQQVLAPGELTVIVNTGDDLERHSLTVSPDNDSVLYALAGIVDEVKGWGISDETWSSAEQLARLGEPTWFRLGDRDLATHLFRTERLRRGMRPTEVSLDLARAFGVPSRILPMADEQVRTRVLTDGDWLDFQDYFVRLHQAPDVRGVRFDGIEGAQATPEVVESIRSADVIVVGPSNPIVSIGAIVAVPGLLPEIVAARRRGKPAVGVSGIVAGKALRGPADRMLTALGEEATALGVARRYAALGLVDAMLLDNADEALAPEVEALGLAAVVTNTIMTDAATRAALAHAVLAAAGSVVSRRGRGTGSR
jgi:LPPG:FO 2-phospho-L-lactate transferase